MRREDTFAFLRRNLAKQHHRFSLTQQGQIIGKVVVICAIVSLLEQHKYTLAFWFACRSVCIVVFH